MTDDGEVGHPPLPDPVLAACLAVGVPDEVLGDTYFLPALDQAAQELACSGATQARTRVQ